MPKPLPSGTSRLPAQKLRKPPTFTMASFSKLPVELILHICSFIHPRQSIRETFHPDVTQEEGFDDLRESWDDLSNLSRTSRQYRAIIAESHLLYRTICVTGNPSQLVVFLKLIKSRPDIAASIHRLFIYHQWVLDLGYKKWFNDYRGPTQEHLALVNYIVNTAWELRLGFNLETSRGTRVSDRQRALIRGIIIHIQQLRRQKHIFMYPSLWGNFPWSSGFPTVPFLNSVTLVVEPIRMDPKPPETRVVTYCILDEHQLMKTIRESQRDAATSLR